MPYLPSLAAAETSRSSCAQFGGYNHNLRIADGEFYDMQNLSTASYPALAVRAGRSEKIKIEAFGGMIAKDALLYVDGSRVVFGEYSIDLALSTDPDNCPKQLVSMGAYVLIFPDGKYLNTQDLSDYGSLAASYTTSGTVTFSICNLYGEGYDYTLSDTQPGEPENGAYWLDTSEKPHVLKVYSEDASMWVQVGTVYVKIESPGIGLAFKQYDGVKITGCTAPGTTDFNGNVYPIWGKGDDYIIIVGLLDSVQTQDGPVTLAREVPPMDFVTESGNRIWGCRYGVEDGKPVNEIYACKLGDPFNWNCFMGASTDSYRVSLGSDGVFTGAITHLGYPLFFKENVIHKVYGSVPANYQLQNTNCRGVQKGSHGSLVIVNETLFYKSATDVCAYDGSLPVTVSGALGDTRYFDAVAGAIGSRYYISMRDAQMQWHMFVFDTAKNLWMKEDGTHALGFCRVDTAFYFVNAKNGMLTEVDAAGAQERVEWFARSGEIGYDYPDNKYISRMVLRMALEPGAEVRLYLRYNSSGGWEYKGQMYGKGTRSFSVPVLPRRCDHFAFKLAGRGGCKILSVTKTLEMGSDG